jgi:leader peptidase (prepilin peptidase)/N-methyltransferase
VPAPISIPFAAVGGLIVGSFLNVVAYRLPRGESLVWPASRCPSCGTHLRAYDNVPVLGWLMLRGRCRSCHDRISGR